MISSNSALDKEHTQDWNYQLLVVLTCSHLYSKKSNAFVKVIFGQFVDVINSKLNVCFDYLIN